MILNDYRYVFIVTYARSGSTLLQSLINSVPGVQIRGENAGTLLHLYRSCLALEETGWHGQQEWTLDPDHPWFGAWEIEVEQLCAELLDLFVAGVLRPAPGIRVTGFKEIRHIPFFLPEDEEFHAYMDFLLERFPGARIVCNSRDAVSVSRSGWLKEEDPQDVQRWVHACDRRFRALAERSGRCLHLQYETYTADPATLSRMFEFLDLPYDARRVQAVLDKRLTHATEKPDRP